jgi:serpin B
MCQPAYFVLSKPACGQRRRRFDVKLSPLASVQNHMQKPTTMLLLLTTLMVLRLTLPADSQASADDARAPDPAPPTPPASAPATATATANAAADGQESFALDLYNHLARTAPPKANLFFSPYSIRTALAMTSAGARGSTAAQMASVLHLQAADNGPKADHPFQHWLTALPTTQPDFQLAIANSVWIQTGYDIQQDFSTALTRDYAAHLVAANFNAAPEPSRTKINQWVQQQTRDHIKDLLPPGSIDSRTRLVLANAVYFKAGWAAPFPAHDTHRGKFHLDPSASAIVHFMRRSDQTMNYFDGGSFQAVELPYYGGEMSMVLLVPGANDGLADLEKQLTADHLQQWLAALQPREVTLTLPRFTMTGQFGLAATLAAMGMTDAFDPQRADFSGIATPSQARREPPLVISQVYHKAFVAVAEEGTEAAAATAVNMAAAAMMFRGPEPVIVTADHPFLLLIRHNPTGTLLFLGRMSDPR